MGKHKVTAVLTHHLNRNQHYLDLALKSLLAQENVDLEIIVVASCIEDPVIPSGVKVLRVPHTMLSTEAYMTGIVNARDDSLFFIIANDDIIASKWAVAHLANQCWNEATKETHPIILNSFSNDGYGTLHFTNPLIKHPTENLYLPMHADVPFDLIEPYYYPILNYVHVCDVITVSGVNCFYFTMIPKAVWQAVGGLDMDICGKQKSSHEDVDFCMRARQKGIACLNTFGSFVWHFGGASVKHTMTQQDRIEGRKAYCEKWKIPYEGFSIPNQP